MKLHLRIVAAAMLGALAAIGLSTIEERADRLSTGVRRAAMATIAQVADVDQASLRVEDMVSTGRLIAQLARSIADGDGETVVTWEWRRIARQSGGAVRIDRVRFTESGHSHRLICATRPDIVAAEALP